MLFTKVWFDDMNINSYQIANLSPLGSHCDDGSCGKFYTIRLKRLSQSETKQGSPSEWTVESQRSIIKYNQCKYNIYVSSYPTIIIMYLPVCRGLHEWNAQTYGEAACPVYHLG